MRVCDVKSHLAMVDISKFEAKKAPSKISGFKSQPYHRANFEIKTILGPADIRFEPWFQGIQYMDKKSIAVEWEKASRKSSRKGHALGPTELS